MTLASLRSNAEPVVDEQGRRTVLAGLSATSVVRQKQHDGSSDHHPAPTHVRFEQANDDAADGWPGPSTLVAVTRKWHEEGRDI